MDVAEDVAELDAHATINGNSRDLTDAACGASR
jgi:hypothetical protein